MTPGKIKELRKKHGLTQADLCNEIGVTVYAVRQWEQGKRTPSRMAVKALENFENRMVGKDVKNG